MRRATLSILLACPVFLTACGTIESKASAGGRMIVSEDSTILYRHMLLKKGVEVKLVKKEFLYSLVELSNGQKGYVANDALALAPSLPERPSAPVSIKPQRKVVSRVKKNSSVASSSTNTSEALPKPSFRY
jgi:uncharacterized protein YgiM (DUF1202 family)